LGGTPACLKERHGFSSITFSESVIYRPIHIRRGFRVNTDVTRLALWVSLAIPLVAAEPDLNTLLRGVEQRYNRAKTLQVHFVESYTVQGRARKSESGELTLRKPGRMRWDYTAPSGKLFISDGKDVYLYTPEANRVEKTKLKASDDMRAPLAFLLGKLDFAKDFRDFEVKPEGTQYLITAKAKNDNFPYEKVQMLVTPDYQIQRLIINLQNQSQLTFDLDGEKVNPAVDDALFKFQMPAGATLVAEGSE
jgi:outer membrane lipoprotein carrier protein